MRNEMKVMSVTSPRKKSGFDLVAPSVSLGAYFGAWWCTLLWMDPVDGARVWLRVDRRRSSSIEIT